MTVEKLGPGPRSSEPSETGKIKQTEDIASAPLSPALSRRSMFGGSVLTGLAALLGPACSNSELNASGETQLKRARRDDPTAAPGTTAGGTTGTVENSPDSNEPGAVAAADGDGIGDIDGGDSGSNSKLGTEDDTADEADMGSGEDECKATRTNKIDPNSLPQAPEDRVPAVKFYGRDNSAMIAMQFSNGEGIAQVLVCKEDGQLLALHGMTGADAGGTRPIIVDNIFLIAVNNIKLVIQMNDGKRYVTMVAKSYYKEFENKAVTDLSMAPNSDEQSVAQFEEVAGSFNVDAAITYPNDFNSGKVRNLQTVKMGTTWNAQGGLKGTATDIMGRPLASLSGATIIEHPTFCTYSGSFRTMIRIG